ncbi:peptide chain release factor N(5)-glutamine methyltransferase [Pararhodobacter sp. SW119]|uniref:peptide chain release factor N(5)-glutamine methyltransferase n=1 Tax=Pararhodobacter sp. SW119 TaxID=2780075 RepID=UPI001AE08162|nr:peptide chain release factor N(5)-glutamine methyltransferase [Pararhodobacter sp. SW119]
MTPRAFLPSAIALLRSAGVDDPARDARRLLAHALGLPADRLTLHLDDALSAPAQARFDAALAARAARQPVSQIIGQRLFWGRAFAVTPDVLDPRPETEVLIASALASPFSRVLDLGTGTGAILLTLLAERPQAVGMGVDISDAALKIASENARALGVADRCELVPSDWFASVEGEFDLIVANPPYLSTEELETLAPETRTWEPELALLGGADGLDAYRRIVEGAATHLAPGGRLIMEIGPTQGAPVMALLETAGFAGLICLPDFDGRDRVVGALAPSAANRDR